MLTAELQKKLSKKFEIKFDKFQNCDILNLTSQNAARRTTVVEIKKFEKKFKTKFDKSQTCAKLNNTLRFGERIKRVDKRSAVLLKVV